MKFRKNYVMLSIAFLLISLAHFWGVSVITGITWLCVAIVHLVVAFVSKDKKRTGDNTVEGNRGC